MILKHLKRFFGLGGRDDGGGGGDREEEGGASAASEADAAAADYGTVVEEEYGPRRGFSVRKPVPIERQPVLAPCDPGEGGVQGFKWYIRKLRMDEDGDVADEFLEEVVSDRADTTPVPKFRVNYNTKPIALSVGKQTVAIDGDILQSLDYQGQLRWV